MNSDDLQRLLAEHTDAWNSHDIDRLMSLFADDCVFDASGGPEHCGRRFRGRDEVRSAFADVFRSMPDANWGDARHFVLSDEFGVSEWRLTATLLDGGRIDVLGCDFLTVRDDRSFGRTPSESSDPFSQRRRSCTWSTRWSAVLCTTSDARSRVGACSRAGSGR